MMDMSAKVVLVTGAGGRLGSAMCRALRSAGADVIAVGRSAASLDKLESTVDGSGGTLHRYVCDLVDTDERTKLIEWVIGNFEKLSGIVNNAYAGKVGTYDTITEEDFILATQFNQVVPLELAVGLLTMLKTTAENDGEMSSIVNVSSMYGVVSPVPAIYGDSGANNPIHYGASKAAMIQMTRYMACHFPDSNVRVNTIAPGPFPDTSVPSSIDGFYESLSAKVPLKRVGKPVEIEGPVLFLLSNASSYVNGATIPVDGGWTAW